MLCDRLRPLGTFPSLPVTQERSDVIACPFFPTRFEALALSLPQRHSPPGSFDFASFAWLRFFPRFFFNVPALFFSMQRACVPFWPLDDCPPMRRSKTNVFAMDSRLFPATLPTAFFRTETPRGPVLVEFSLLLALTFRDHRVLSFFDWRCRLFAFLSRLLCLQARILAASESLSFAPMSSPWILEC